jgi:hypothetical protein
MCDVTEHSVNIHYHHHQMSNFDCLNLGGVGGGFGGGRGGVVVVVVVVVVVPSYLTSLNNTTFSPVTLAAPSLSVFSAEFIASFRTARGRYKNTF